MDLKTLDLAASGAASLTLRHPSSGENILDAEGNEVTISLLGKDSKEYRAAVAKVANANMRSRKSRTVEQSQQDGIDLLASVTTGWSGVEEDGEMLEPDTATVRRIYREYVWIREQVDEFVDDRANFLAIA